MNWDFRHGFDCLRKNSSFFRHKGFVQGKPPHPPLRPWIPCSGITEGERCVCDEGEGGWRGCECVEVPASAGTTKGGAGTTEGEREDVDLAGCWGFEFSCLGGVSDGGPGLRGRGDGQAVFDNGASDSPAASRGSLGNGTGSRTTPRGGSRPVEPGRPPGERACTARQSRQSDNRGQKPQKSRHEQALRCAGF